MRTRPFALILALSLCAPAEAETRNFGVSGFTRIRVDGPFRVRLATGVAPFASASGSPAALNRVAIDVQGTTLVVHPESGSWGGYPGQDVGPVDVRIGTHELTAAWLNGSGTLAIDRVEGLKFDLSVQGSGAIGVDRADVDQLTLSITGTAGATVAGRADKLTAIVRGISSLDAAGLSAKDATIGAEGAATVKANVANAATVDGSGPATITLSGGPACTLRIVGSATVSGCRATQ
jgi:hypothetical protein